MNFEISSASDRFLRFIGETDVTPQIRGVQVPRHVCQLIFIFLVCSKLENVDDLRMTWVAVFVPLFIYNIAFLVLFVKDMVSYPSRVLALGTPSPVIIQFIQCISLALGEIGVCVYLNASKDLFGSTRTTQPVPANNFASLIYALIPYWSLQLLKTVVSVVAIFTRSGILNSHRDHYFACKQYSLGVARITFMLLINGVQPLLIACKIDNVLKISWSLVFSPIWFGIFTGISCGLLLVMCSPYLHENGTGTLRDATARLVAICSGKLFLQCTAGMCFLIFVVQKLDFTDGASDSGNFSPIHLVLPLVIAEVILLALFPIQSKAIKRYNNALQALDQFQLELQQQNLANPALNSVKLTKVKGVVYLEEHTLTRYSKLGFDVLQEFAEELSQITRGKESDFDNEGSSQSTVKEETTPLHTCISVSEVEMMPFATSQQGCSPSNDELCVVPTVVSTSHISRPNDTSDVETGSLVSTSQSGGPQEVPAGERNSVNHNASMCVICFTEVSTACVMDCGHRIMCWQCARTVYRSTYAQCPVCREPIKQLLRITNNATKLSDGRMVIAASEGYKLAFFGSSMAPLANVYQEV